MEQIRFALNYAIILLQTKMLDNSFGKKEFISNIFVYEKYVIIVVKHKRACKHFVLMFITNRKATKFIIFEKLCYL